VGGSCSWMNHEVIVFEEAHVTDWALCRSAILATSWPAWKPQAYGESKKLTVLTKPDYQRTNQIVCGDIYTHTHTHTQTRAGY